MGKKKSAALSTEDKIIKGAEAQATLANPVIQEPFEKLEDIYINTWMFSALDDIEKREQAYLSLHALRGLSLEINSMIDSGKLAKT